MYCNGVIDGVVFFEMLFVYFFIIKIFIVNFIDDIYNFVIMLELRIWYLIIKVLLIVFFFFVVCLFGYVLLLFEEIIKWL